MNQGQILNDLQVLMGEVGPAALSFTGDHYAAALQWAQSQTCRLLGLSYEELIVGTSGATGPWGESMTTVPIPTDAIKVTRCELAVLPFTITVTPARSIIQFDDNGDQIGYLELAVKITRAPGYTKNITLSSPVFAYTDDFQGEFNGNTYPSQESAPETIPDVQDSNTLTVSTTLTGWNEVAANWASAVITGVGDDGWVGVSNEFSVTEPAGPYMTVAVTPTQLSLTPSSPPTPMIFTATLTPYNGYNEPVTIVLPHVLATVNPDAGTGPDYEANITMNGVPAVVGTPGIVSTGAVVCVDTGPVTFLITVALGSSSIGPTNTDHMQLTVFGTDSEFYNSNEFGVGGGG